MGRLAARLIEAQQKGDPEWIHLAQELAARAQIELAARTEDKARSVARVALDLAVAIRELMSAPSSKTGGER